ncbi:MAG: DUF4412 domain-containing protein [Deltaproteobacteria bacterium]|nr:DUF4412 domain-containing protein [Deltaproteobacteria bacterium]
MHSRKIVATIMLSALFFLSFGLIPVLQAAEFSADMETKSRGQIVTQGKIFMKGDLSRHEMNQGGRQITLINRPDKGVVWTLMPQEKSYLEMAFDPEKGEMMSGDWSQDLKKEGKPLGSETVNGIKCNKYELVDDGKKVTYWIAKKEELPVRIISSEIEVNYRNIRLSNQPDHLFQIPSGYRKLVMPQIPGMPGMGNMQGMPGGGNMPSFPSSR